MAKLLPPYVDGKLPAQSDIACLKIPYRLNRAVGINDFDSVVIKIKDLNTNEDVSAGYSYNSDSSVKGSVAVFTFEQPFGSQIECKLEYGKHYKVQLAFKKSLEEGYYSTVGVFKLGTPGVSVIVNLISSITNTFPFFLQGRYDPVSYDSTEKAYSYRFIIKDSDDELLESSEELFTPFYAVKMRPEEETIYKIIMETTTINGFLSQSKSYGVQREWATTGLTIGPSDVENGYNRVEFTPEANKLYLFEASGGRYIQDFVAETSETLILIDSNAEHGSTETYHIYEINSQGQPECEYYTNEVYTAFDDIFLSDEDRSVCIKYNPQVSSFKTNILESKQETLGGQYPYFFRNGTVMYNEFPISGLISRLAEPSADSETRTETNAGSQSSSDWSTNLTHENFAAERNYKMSLLKWLNNGKTKLFRSPAEGNYYVRLMGVSLSPNQTLGRMLHTFNCTAYEVEAPKNKMFQNEDKLSVPLIKAPKTVVTRQVQPGYFSLAVDKVENVRYDGVTENGVTAYEDSVTIYTVNGKSKTIDQRVDISFADETGVIQIAGFSSRGGILSYAEAQSSFEKVEIIEYFYERIKDDKLFEEITIGNHIDKIVIYCDEKAIVENKDINAPWDDNNIWQPSLAFRYATNSSEVDAGGIPLGKYKKESDEITYIEDEVVVTEPTFSQLWIAPGVRVRVYRTVEASS